MQNPLDSYRRAQRELRRQFDVFTRANCPTCPTPCCLRPARIVPTDILLAEATGWRANLPANDSPNAENRLSSPVDMVAEVAGRVAEALGADEEAEAEAGSLPCEYLGASGCAFPADLRPFGCTTYICKYMYQKLDRASLARIKRLVRDLEEKHTLLMRALNQKDNDDEA